MPSVSTTLIVLAVIACVLALLVIAVCLATAARPKSAVEQAYEDEMQIRYLKERMKKHSRKRK
jgi:beta-lactamase regulating signal transducer with metallopeptidase domain